MKMDATDVKKFPKMAYYVRVNIPDVIKVPSIVRAFEKIGGINKTTLRGARAALGDTMSVIVKHRTDLDLVAERVGVKLAQRAA